MLIHTANTDLYFLYLFVQTALDIFFLRLSTTSTTTVLILQYDVSATRRAQV